MLLELGRDSTCPRLDRILDPLVITDLATAVWAPHGHDDGVDALCGLAQVVLRDSVDGPDARAALDARGASCRERTYVVDLAWLRTTPWRERIAATFDPPAWRGHLRKLSARDRAPQPGLAPPRRCCSSAGWRAAWGGSRRR